MDLKHFKFEHLPPNLLVISREVSLLASYMNSTLPESAEKSAGMRKLLEAKDCFVRAQLDGQENITKN